MRAEILGQVIETSEAKLTYTRHEPIGVVGQIIPWNFPRTSLSRALMHGSLTVYVRSANDGVEDRSRARDRLRDRP